MALTRSMLKAMGIEPEKVDEIIGAHVESIDALKDQISELKETAKEVDKLKAENERLKEEQPNGDEWEEKYQTEHEAFEAYKKEIKTQETTRAKLDKFRTLLDEVGLTGKLAETIIKTQDMDKIELTDDGELSGADALKGTLEADWKDYIGQSRTGGTTLEDPPAGDPANDFGKMTLSQKMQYANEHPDAREVVKWMKG